MQLLDKHSKEQLDKAFPTSGKGYKKLQTGFFAAIPTLLINWFLPMGLLWFVLIFSIFYYLLWKVDIGRVIRRLNKKLW